MASSPASPGAAAVGPSIRLPWSILLIIMQTSNMKSELLAREVQGALQTTQVIAISSGYSPELVERQFLNTLHTLVEDIETPSWD